MKFRQRQRLFSIVRDTIKENPGSSREAIIELIAEKLKNDSDFQGTGADAPDWQSIFDFIVKLITFLMTLFG